VPVESILTLANQFATLHNEENSLYLRQDCTGVKLEQINFWNRWLWMPFKSEYSFVGCAQKVHALFDEAIKNKDTFNNQETEKIAQFLYWYERRVKKFHYYQHVNFFTQFWRWLWGYLISEPTIRSFSFCLDNSTDSIEDKIACLFSCKQSQIFRQSVKKKLYGRRRASTILTSRFIQECESLSPEIMNLLTLGCENKNFTCDLAGYPAKVSIKKKGSKTRVFVRQYFTKGAFKKIFRLGELVGDTYDHIDKVVAYVKPIKNKDKKKPEQKQGEIGRAQMLIKREIAVARALQKKKVPYVARVKEVFYDKKPALQKGMIMNFYSSGNLKEYIHKNIGQDRNINEKAHQIAQALAKAHNGFPVICFIDLKPENILLDELGDIVIIDFGLVKILPREGDFECRFAGTAPFAAPEQIQAHRRLRQREEKTMKVSPAMDIWAFGLILFELHFGIHLNPFHYIDMNEELRSVEEQRNEAYKKISSFLKKSHNPIAPIIIRMLSIDPAQRPTAENLVRELEELVKAS